MSKMADTSAGCLKKGERKRVPWTTEEDRRLISYIAINGEGRWDLLAKASGLNRSGRSCRLRWVNYLSPDLNHNNITAEEERLIINLHACWGNRQNRQWNQELLESPSQKKFQQKENVERKVHYESSTLSSSLPTPSESPTIDLEKGTEKEKEQKDTAISSFHGSPIHCEEQNAAHALDGVEIRAALAQVEDSTDLAYNFSRHIFYSELSRNSEVDYSLHSTPSPEAFSSREFYSDELWNMDL